MHIKEPDIKARRELGGWLPHSDNEVPTPLVKPLYITIPLVNNPDPN